MLKRLSGLARLHGELEARGRVAELAARRAQRRGVDVEVRVRRGPSLHRVVGPHPIDLAGVRDAPRAARLA